MTNAVFPELPEQAMVLAAGRGVRLLPLTLTRPKPLATLAGTTLIDHTLDRLSAAGVTRVVINVHYMGEMVMAHLRDRRTPEITFSVEDELLDTGGGIVRALSHFGGEPFVSVNSDVVWRDAFGQVLQRLGRGFDAAQMDALLLLQPSVHALAYRGKGDFNLTPAGRVSRRRPRRVAAFVYTGLQILHPRLFQGMAEEPFSINLAYDRAMESGRLYGLRHDGNWVDAGHHAGLKAAARLLKGQI